MKTKVTTNFNDAKLSRSFCLSLAFISKQRGGVFSLATSSSSDCIALRTSRVGLSLFKMFSFDKTTWH